VPDGTSENVNAAVDAARDAFEEWRATTPSERRRILHQIGELVDECAEELGTLETRQNGKLLRDMQGQMEGLGEWYLYFAGYVDKHTGSINPVENKDGRMLNYTLKEPHRVVGAITPWNSPLLLTTFKLAPALATGNTMVHKPSKQTPVSALRFAELLYAETDLTTGVYNVVTGTGSGVGSDLVAHDGIDKLAFTGSTDVGRAIAREAGDQLIPVSLELGGKSPNVVLPSANLQNAVNGVIKGIFAATGQTCLAGSRVFVHEDVYDEFLDAFVDRAADIRLGDPMDPETEMGAPGVPRPVGNRQRVRRHRQAGRSDRRIRRRTTRQLPGEFFLQPTILTDVDNDMQVAREEIFGPVAAVMSFASEAEVLEFANDTDFGLAAGVWTEDMRQAHRMAARLDAGNVWINEYRILTYSTPFGGFKDSGLGSENGAEVLEEYTRTKSVWINQAGEVSDPFQLG